MKSREKEQDFTTFGKLIHPDRIVDLLVENDKVPRRGKHNCFRLCIVESGSLLLRLNGTRILVESPACLCLNNEDILTEVKAEGYSAKTIHFKPLVINSRFGKTILSEKEKASFSFSERQDYIWLQPFINDDVQNSKHIKLGPFSLKKSVQLCMQLDDQLEQQPDIYWPCRARSFFLEIIYAIHNMQNRYEGFKNSLAENSEPIDEILLFLHSSYNEKITLAELSEKFAVNRTKLNEMFLSATGRTVIRYLIEVRVRLACLILRDTMRPIKEIAYQTGFSDLSHFGRTFKKHIECSPQEYRTKFNWMMV